jgi:L-alanine-DL-glutamate epimerase-like enolase superfamily enzyme
MPAPTIQSLYRHGITEHVVGSDPRHINTIRALFRQTTFKKYLNEQVFLAPLEMACWDILGKCTNLPLHALLGGKIRDSIPCAFPIGVLPVERLLTSVGRAVERGYRTFKLKGETDFRNDLARLNALAKNFPSCQFRLDPNQAWTIGDCVRFVHALDAPTTVEYLEQPVRVQSLDEIAALRQRSPIPIALNDDCYGPWTLDAITRAGAADVGIVDLEPLGGVSGVVRAAHFAETTNLALTHHTGFDYGVKTAAVLHVTSALPAFRAPIDCAYMSQDDDVLTTRLRIEAGQLPVPNAPGLGIEVDRAKLQRYKI